MNLHLLGMCIAIMALFVALCQSAEVELREDFSGMGEFQTRSELYGVQEKASTKDGQLIFGHVLASNQTFSGFSAEGNSSSYLVASADHYLCISKASSINATAKTSRTKYEWGGEERYTLFSAQGNGTVKELATASGEKRPIELSSIRHRGTFSLNSSMRTSYTADAGDTP